MRRVIAIIIVILCILPIVGYCIDTNSSCNKVAVRPTLQKDSITSSKGEKITLTNFESIIKKSPRYGGVPSMLTFKYGSNGKEEEVGRAGNRLRPYINKCPAAVAELDSLKMEVRKERRLTLLTITLFAGTLGITIVYAAYVPSQPWVPLIGEAVLGCASLIPIGVYHPKLNGFDQIRRGVEEYNKWVGP